MKLKICGACFMALLLFINSTSCATLTPYSPLSPETSEDDANWQTAGPGEQVSLENADVRLTLDAATTHFTIESKTEAIRFDSCLDRGQALYSSDVQERMQSEITLIYYEEQSAAQYMFSNSDSVALGNYRVSYTDDRIRVTYTFGATEESIFIPYVFSQETFEALIAALQSDDNPDGAAMSRRLNRFYTLYTAETADESIRTAYPAVDQTPLYILNDSATENDIAEIKEYMTLVQYDKASYESDLEALGLSAGESADAPGFVVPIEYALQSDGFTARILTDRINELSDTYKLQSIVMLEYFAASEESDGRFFVPDGSGAVIDWSANHVSAFSQAFYGQDYSVQSDKKTQLAQTMCLPVYGVDRPQGGVMIVVEEGAENGTVYAESPDCSATPHHIYTTFTMRHMDTTDIGADQLIPVYNLFSEELTAISPAQRYILLDPGNSSWQDMASRYRQYLLNTGGIRQSDSLDTPLYLTYLGMFIDEANVLGIPYNKKIVLSTTEEIQQDWESLSDHHIGDTVIRLVGFSSDGLTPKANNCFDLYGKTGSSEQLQTLHTALQTNGGRLYIDGDFAFAYSSGNGFSPRTDSAHYLNRVLVRNGNYNIVTREYQDDFLPRYFVSPKRYLDYAQGYLSDAVQTLGIRPNVSYGTLGRYLGGDYTSNFLVDRSSALASLKQALEAAQGMADHLCFDNGNSYVLPYASDLYNVPLLSSSFDAEGASVPFMQKVLHGLIPYTGVSLNLSYDRNEYLLRSIEYGAVLSYTMITRENALLLGTDLMSVYYAVNSGDNLADFLELWPRIGDFQRAVADQEMIAHQKITDTVYRTTYANGYSAYVNYGDSDHTEGTLTVKAHDFAFMTGDER